ncbi:phosphatase PAP2 family protein [Streptomyces melanogenes]|uniref:Phosphatase PAP2 family protein n=1 Tax=Streptomyces melanogenes TaxID=67326 RepID=A0ABZ1XS84_9ACTN|nr:phosphatase PAP2 family protein [Streptomyces melanogenes]
MAAGIRPGTRRPTGPETTGTSRPPLVRELLLVTALFVVYKFGRQLANGHETRAFTNADRVWDWERALHLPGEGAVQRLLLHDETVVQIANTFYAAVHFPATIAFLVWLYVKRPAHYLWSRRVLALVTTAALALHILLPLAPPRMLASAGLVDTAQVYGPSVYSAKPDTDTMANQFAAMPSLHFGWALMVAIGLIAATRGRWRWLWLLHPALTLLVIVGTANHYWLDALVATVLLGAALSFVPRPQPVRGGRTVAVHVRRSPVPRPAVAPEPARAPESALTSGRTGVSLSADADRLAEALR